MLSSLAIGEVPGLWQLFFTLLCVLVLWAGSLMYKATQGGVVLTKDGLQSTNGQVLAALDNIKQVDRGAFAFKPSNGFQVRLLKPQPRGWAVGVWWRFGTRLGVGGTLSAGQTRALADLLAAQLVERDGEA